MKKKIVLLTFFILIAFIASVIAYCFIRSDMMFSLAVTFGTTFYHFAMRLLVGLSIDKKYHNEIDYTKSWFKERAFEQKFYELIKVKKWKKKLPTFNPQDFNLKQRSIEEVIKVTCQAEIVHEIIMVLSFVPILFSIWFGSLDVFIITSCISFLFDSIFVITQRYNRPWLLKKLQSQLEKK